MPLALFFKIPSKSKTSLDTLLTSSPLPWVFINSSILVSPSNPPAYFVQPRLSAIKCLDEHPLHTVITMPLRYAFQKGEKGESQSVSFFFKLAINQAGFGFPSEEAQSYIIYHIMHMPLTHSRNFMRVTSFAYFAGILQFESFGSNADSFRILTVSTVCCGA